MNTKRMGRDGPEVPVVCFGTWPLGGAYGAVEEQQAIATVHAAMDAGLTFFDTAEGYGSEAIIGKAIKGRRHGLFLATKLSGDDHSTQYMERTIENSLRALGTDYADLYQLHRASKRPIEDTMADLLRLREAGKIRYIGISNFSAEQIEEAVQHGPIHSDQPRYSILFREVEEDILPACLANGVGVMAHSVLAKGLLAGRYRPGHQFPPDDERHYWPLFQGESFRRTFAVTERLKEWAADQGRDLVQLAIAWPVAAHPAVYTSIVGGRRPEQLRHIAMAGDWKLTQQDLCEIDDIQGNHRLRFVGPDIGGRRGRRAERGMQGADAETAR